MAERGPLERIPDAAIERPNLGVPLRTTVAIGMTQLTGADVALRSAADQVANSFKGTGDDGILGLLNEANWQLGDIPGILNTNELDAAQRGVDGFRDRINNSDDTLER